MGITLENLTQDQLCDLMCDNTVPFIDKKFIQTGALYELMNEIADKRDKELERKML